MTEQQLSPTQQVEQERQALYEIIEKLFRHPMVADIRACRSCGVPVLHMEHLKLDEAKAIEAKVWELLKIEPVKEDHEL